MRQFVVVMTAWIVAFLLHGDARSADEKVDWKAKLAAISAEAKAAKSNEEEAEIASRFAEFAQTAAAADAFDPAEDALRSAKRYARMSQDEDLEDEIKDIEADIEDLSGEYDDVQRALKRLARNKEDAIANRTAALYYCFTKEDWKTGLPYLAKANDERLQNMAWGELGGIGYDLWMRMGDDWWSYGKEKRAAFYRNSILNHAQKLFEQARDRTKDEEKKKAAEAKIKALDQYRRYANAKKGREKVDLTGGKSKGIVEAKKRSLGIMSGARVDFTVKPLFVGQTVEWIGAFATDSSLGLTIKGKEVFSVAIDYSGRKMTITTKSGSKERGLPQSMNQDRLFRFSLKNGAKEFRILLNGSSLGTLEHGIDPETIDGLFVQGTGRFSRIQIKR